MAGMSDFVLHFDKSAFKQLDRFAQLACQVYNLGDDTQWFNTFRSGLNGFYLRLYGVATHYQDVHTWIPRVRHPFETEYHMTSVLFNMDSSLECLVFALNALGYAAAPHGFRSVTDRKELQHVLPRDIIGTVKENGIRDQLLGYEKVFPTIRKYWMEKRALIDAICELHDVSKHRQTIYMGGKKSTDPPPGFYERLGVAGKRDQEWCYWPDAEIILRDDPKAPEVNRSPDKRKDWATLEELAEEFIRFVNQTGLLALGDATSNIQLPHREFLRGS